MLRLDKKMPLGDGFDVHCVDLHILSRLVLRIALDLGDCVNDILTFYYFTEDGVITGEPGCRGNRDEKLTPICIGTRVRHSELARLVELVGRALGLVGEFVARSTHASSAWVT